MTGILEKQDDIWVVKWSDLHSFVYGTIYTYTPLHKDYIDEANLKNGDDVEFEFISIGYNPHGYTKILNK